ncbi:SDR family oxidoreductase [Beijerinckia indica]|uniref:3-beta hydroxysteroid dehydrogenase/isomerase n=1 Tax=Beijerinckia indica subsp. indica (strain ATCC 9039 / DSM 1715 / NCIMB 8712) TaxID=395963 RepID=B2IDU2_BEII9|nr:SDR family oxidoreductase [Beijerinckia indica]ACB96874.1 3-beta hydroxysteroid dehydrogenase/isomerase [Beijerinckia indica subsp. indica ATCC 9039]
MKLFVFGLGYSALHFIDRFGASFETISGTVRTEEKVQQLASDQITPLLFGPEKEDPAILDWLGAADAVIVSIPPGVSVDPVLSRFGRRIAGLHRPQTIIYLSTIGVYGDRQGQWVDESRPATPTSERARTRVQAEKSWAALGKSKEKNVHVLRLAGIYGPGRNALVNLRAGTAHRIIKPDQVFNRIHVDDIASAIAGALAYDGRNEVWNVSDDEPAPPQDVVTYAAELLGVTPPPEITLEAAEISPLTRSFYAENKRASNLKLKQELRMELAYPTYREGLTALWEGGEGRL